MPADYLAGNINNEVYVMITDKDPAMKYIKDAMRLIENLTGNGKRSSERVFSDFLILSACSYSNFFDSRFREEREQRYLEIIKGYEKKEIAVFSEILGAISNAAISYWNRGEIKDILGYLYTKGQYYKKSLGQFFTPEHVAYFMARITGSDYKDLLKKREFISISEPTCGSGVMVLAFCQMMLEDKMDYSNRLLVNAWDIDETCALMAYLQFSIYGVPAIVTHGDTLAQKAYSQWVTPAYFANDFCGKQQRMKMIEALKELMAAPNAEAVVSVKSELADIDMQNIREKFELQSLFEAG